VIESGDSVWYDITFVNTKTTVAEWVRVLDRMPSNMEYIGMEVLNGDETTLNVSHDTSTNILDIYVWDMEVWASYIVRVETVVTGNNQDEVTNNVSIYTEQELDDPIEEEHDDEKFDDNLDDVTIKIEHCTTDGVIYLDVDNNNRYGSGDVLLPEQEVNFLSAYPSSNIWRNRSRKFVR